MLFCVPPSKGQLLFKKVIGSQGSGNVQFNFPSGIFVEKKTGKIFITDSGNNRVQVLDKDGNFLLKFGSPGNGNGQFNSPIAVAVDSLSNIFVVDYNNQRVQKFDASGNFILKFGTAGDGNGQFMSPNGIALDSDNNVYISDFRHAGIQKFSNSGAYLNTIGNRLSEGSPVINANNEIFALTVGSTGLIQKFNIQGQLVSSFGDLGPNSGYLNNPTALALDEAGSLYVTDTDNNRVQKFMNNQYVWVYGVKGSAEGQVHSPLGISIKRNELYISEGGNHRLQVFQLPKMDQSITFSELPQLVITSGSFLLEANASSGLPVVFTSSNPDVASIEGVNVILKSIGTTNITAQQSGNDTFNPALSVTRKLEVIKDQQTISFDVIDSKKMGDPPFNLSAFSTSGLEIFYTSSNADIATVSNGIVTIVESGSILIHADQAGDTFFHPAERVSRELIIDKGIITEVEKVFEKTFRIYPNPADEYISVESGQGYLYLFDSQGKMVLFGEIKGGEIIDIHHLHKGCYYARFLNKNDSYNSKIVIR